MPRYIQYTDLAQVLRPFTSNVGAVQEILFAFDQAVSNLVKQDEVDTPALIDVSQPNPVQEDNDGAIEDDRHWFMNQYEVAQDVALQAVGPKINVYDHTNPIAHPSEDAFCVLCQGTAEDEEETKELRFWVNLRV
ncbi:hypothetical protein A1F97_05430 [Pyrenophora tritici-repentis]|uniref:Uncharacterized protein n=1 Tax=Pyrenophora tritici-repentis TaxID=45151 RepID=A0A2W1EUQ0_9PLEO|nr:hypothetical protein PtrM4_061310 [Pyrenophora tritici-repentis]KAI0579655.1 hypothetical protein Alg215_05640 [Pyrenophora tritici-repentis]KAI1518581.1 hypothetical protein Ptr86124_001709 [Pyrenophora tritici-repentis]KAI1672146.1 hypothetical protein L13192_03005 [Pyrenophora tritici-repentis]KAI1686156.1 hypothetical protein KJE20_04121 [Pyrenophora tritici-repentis]